MRRLMICFMMMPALLRDYAERDYAAFDEMRA